MICMCYPTYKTQEEYLRDQRWAREDWSAYIGARNTTAGLANYRPESDSERVQREIKELRRKYRQKRQARSQA